MAERGWGEDWARRVAGMGCPMCANVGKDETGHGVRVGIGRFSDVYLMRATPVPGYTIAIWNGEHVSEPTELDPAAASGYWAEVTAAAAAVSDLYHPAKMNYLTLGNGVPHLHTHILPRPFDDPSPGAPFPWDLVSSARPLPEDDLLRQVQQLTERLSDWPRRQ